ncbi:MAG: hypothetical protein OEL88_11225 [Sterolibacteriaceae bacterium MAG5]|nr:hypothetical protein [Candidatus Nitricoxidireducens bremensis]
MNYIFTLLGTAAVLVISAATLNWTIDPAGLFRKASFGQQYADALVASAHGLITPDSLDEREFKGKLAKHSGRYDCVVIGSSHVMQIGSARKHRSLPACASILNLGVSGAGIEDHVVLSWLALTAGKPRALILGIDPWTLAFGKDDRWRVRYADQYPIARLAIDGKETDNGESANRWSSLINAQYTRRSLGMLIRGAATPSIDVARNVDEDVGDKLAITLSDGSHVYSAEYIASSKRETVPIGGVAYKTDIAVNNAGAIDLYRRLIMWARDHGVKPVLLMTPYHPNVWMLEASPNVKVMVPIEKAVRKMGSDLNVPVVGSFRPDVVGCAPNEFYDFMHPMASCLAKFTARADF